MLLVRVDDDDLWHHARRPVEGVGAGRVHAGHLGVALVVVLHIMEFVKVISLWCLFAASLHTEGLSWANVTS